MPMVCHLPDSRKQDFWLQETRFPVTRNKKCWSGVWLRRGLLYTMGGQFLRSSFLFRRRCVSEVQGSNPTSSRLFISSCESSESSSALRLRPARLLTLLPHTPALSPSRDPAAPDPDPPLLFALASVLALLLLLPLLPPILLRPPTRQSRCFCCSFCCSRSACAFPLICVAKL